MFRVVSLNDRVGCRARLAQTTRTFDLSRIHLTRRTITTHSTVRRITTPITLTPLTLAVHQPIGTHSSRLIIPTSTSTSLASFLSRIGRRYDASWTGASKTATPFPHSSSKSHSSSYNKSTYSSGADRSLLIFSTPTMRYMRGMGYALLFVILPATVFITWPLIYKEWQMTQQPPEKRVVKKDHDQWLLPSLVVINVTIFAITIGLQRFHRRLIHTIRLYPQTRTLACEMVNFIRKTPPTLIPLEAIIPPIARTGHEEAVRHKIVVLEHPTITLEQAEGQVENKPVAPSTTLTPPAAYWVFPLPNVATIHSDYTSTEKELIDQFWLRTLTTNLHSNQQLEQLAKLNVTHGR